MSHASVGVERAPWGTWPGLALVLVTLSVTLLFGFLMKADPVFRDGRCFVSPMSSEAGLTMCFSDPLYYTESLQTHRLPYLDGCTPAPEYGVCDEYPVLMMYTMWLAAVITRGYRSFFLASGVLLSIAAVVTAVSLFRMTGQRALYFTLAPTLLLTGFSNWDLVAVALATAATLAFLSKRNEWAGILIGLGAAFKFYPALLVIPFALERFHQGDRRGALRLSWTAAGAWLAVNLPFIVFAPRNWWIFFRFGAARGLGSDSLWYIGCRSLRPASLGQCLSPRLVNVLSVAIIAAIGTVVWHTKTRRDPRWPRWTFAFPLLLLFLLANKAFSPQYMLWVLPWFPLVLPSLGALSPLPLFVMLETTDVGSYFVTQYGAEVSPHWGLFAIPLVVRAFMLALCVAAWVGGSRPSLGTSDELLEPAPS